MGSPTSVFVTMGVVGIAFFLSGGIMIFQGLSRRNTPDSSGAQREAYLAAASAHDLQKQFITWQGNVSQYNPNEVSSFTIGTSEVVIGGSNNEGTAGKISQFASATLETYSYNGASTNIWMNFGNISRSWPMSVNRKEDLRCGRELCSSSLGIGCSTKKRTTSSSTSKDSIYCADTTKLREHCTRTYNSLATFQQTNGNCFEDDVCGYCEYTAFAQTLCAVVDIGLEGQVTLNQNKLSCNYPFGIEDGTYTPVFPPEGQFPTSTTIGTRAVTVEVRSSKDPKIALSTVTRGTNEFDNVEKEKAEGTIYIVAGAVLIVLGFLALGFIGLTTVIM